MARPEAESRTGLGNSPQATFSRIWLSFSRDLVHGRGHAKDAAGEGTFHQYAPRFLHLWAYCFTGTLQLLDLERT